MLEKSTVVGGDQYRNISQERTSTTPSNNCLNIKRSTSQADSSLKRKFSSTPDLLSPLVRKAKIPKTQERTSVNGPPPTTTAFSSTLIEKFRLRTVYKNGNSFTIKLSTGGLVLPLPTPFNQLLERAAYYPRISHVIPPKFIFYNINASVLKYSLAKNKNDSKIPSTHAEITFLNGIPQRIQVQKFERNNDCSFAWGRFHPIFPLTINAQWQQEHDQQWQYAELKVHGWAISPPMPLAIFALDKLRASETIRPLTDNTASLIPGLKSRQQEDSALTQSSGPVKAVDVWTDAHNNVLRLTITVESSKGLQIVELPLQAPPNVDPNNFA